MILIAKNSETLKYLVSEFKNKRIKKTYLALVLGFLPKKGKIENYLSKDFRKRKTTINTEEKGKIAISIFRSIKYFYAEKNLYNFTLAEIEIITGRTHQSS